MHEQPDHIERPKSDEAGERPRNAPSGPARAPAPRPRSTVRVEFSDPEEFIDELQRRGPNVEPLVRVTFRWTADANLAPVDHVAMLASYLRRTGDVVAVVELTRPLGAVWRGVPDETSRRVLVEAHQLRMRLAQAVEALGLEVAVGVYQETGAS